MGDASDWLLPIGYVTSISLAAVSMTTRIRRLYPIDLLG
jgi:hypothetical protein